MTTPSICPVGLVPRLDDKAEIAASVVGSAGADLPPPTSWSVRPAVDADLDVIVEQTWEVAAEGRWLGVEVPFDRDARRQLLAAALEADASTLLVADARPLGGPAVVGDVWVRVAPYGVADIGMLVTR
ncbi:MAG: hypothetical protein ACRDYC_05980, partial [Acidimicrobiales bacterium]